VDLCSAYVGSGNAANTPLSKANPIFWRGCSKPERCAHAIGSSRRGLLNSSMQFIEFPSSPPRDAAQIRKPALRREAEHDGDVGRGVICAGDVVFSERCPLITSCGESAVCADWEPVTVLLCPKEKTWLSSISPLCFVCRPGRFFPGVNQVGGHRLATCTGYVGRGNSDRQYNHARGMVSFAVRSGLDRTTSRREVYRGDEVSVL